MQTQQAMHSTKPRSAEMAYVLNNAWRQYAAAQQDHATHHNYMTTLAVQRARATLVRLLSLPETTHAVDLVHTAHGFRVV